MDTIKVCGESLDDLELLIFEISSPNHFVEYKGPYCFCDNHCEIDPDDVRHADQSDYEEEDQEHYCKELYIEIPVVHKEAAIGFINQLGLEGIKIVEKIE